MGDLEARQSANEEMQAIALLDKIVDLDLLMRHINGWEMPDIPAELFFRVGFTHHSEILAKEKSLQGRLFYIAKCANGFWSVEALKTHLRGELYLREGTMPSNFLQTLSVQEQAHRALRSFKDEYLLDYVNIEDDDDPDERVLERGIVADIKKFIMRFGDKFCYIGNQHRIIFEEQEHFIDLLFFNRELHCLVAIELKRGEFKPQYLGQLQFYLSLLDDFVRQPDENQSIGILLCKEANRSVVEYAVRDYNKPMGVATYKTRNDMPETWKDALPDIEDMRKLLEAAPDESEGGE
jgi:predicted nuclease of restriction endonuclease-like (RecB) superfamily